MFLLIVFSIDFINSFVVFIASNLFAFSLLKTTAKDGTNYFIKWFY